MKTICETLKLGMLTLVATIGCSVPFAALADTKMPDTDTRKEMPKPMLNDGQVTTILATIGNNEIASGQLAVTKAENQVVKAYGQKMIDEHTKMNNMVRSLMQTAQIQSVDAPMALSLRQQGTSDLADLSKLKNGKEFEVAYLQKQIVAHQMALVTMEKTLVPSTTNPSLKTLITGAQPVVQQHLEMAKKILVDLSK